MLPIIPFLHADQALDFIYSCVQGRVCLLFFQMGTAFSLFHFLTHRIKTKASMSVLLATKDSVPALQNTPNSTSKNRAIRCISASSVMKSLRLLPPPHPPKSPILALKNSPSWQSAWREAPRPSLRPTKRTCKWCVWLAIWRCQRKTTLCLSLFVTHRCVRSASRSC